MSKEYVRDTDNMVTLYREGEAITFNHPNGNTYKVVSVNEYNAEKLEHLVNADRLINAYVETGESEIKCRISYGGDFDIRWSDVACLVDVFLTPELIKAEVLAYLKSEPAYAYASGTAPYDKFSATLLTIANYSYEIHVERVSFFHHFADKNVQVVITDDNKLNIKHGDRTIPVLIISIGDAVSHEDVKLTEAQADRIFHVLAGTTPCLPYT